MVHQGFRSCRAQQSDAATNLHQPAQLQPKASAAPAPQVEQGDGQRKKKQEGQHQVPASKVQVICTNLACAGQVHDAQLSGGGVEGNFARPAPATWPPSAVYLAALLQLVGHCTCLSSVGSSFTSGTAGPPLQGAAPLAHCHRRIACRSSHSSPPPSPLSSTRSAYSFCRWL